MYDIDNPIYRQVSILKAFMNAGEKGLTYDEAVIEVDKITVADGAGKYSEDRDVYEFIRGWSISDVLEGHHSRRMYATEFSESVLSFLVDKGYHL